jgi:protein-arginine kinase activator protein McsA
MITSGVLGTVCERCKQRVADCHFVGLVDGREQSEVVCLDCYQELVERELRYAETHCRYCGNPPTVVNTSINDFTRDEPPFRLCGSCAKEYKRIFMEEFVGKVAVICEVPLLEHALNARGRIDAGMRKQVADVASPQFA